MTPQYAELILPFKLDGTFTYSVPVSMAHSIQKGARVLVSFGRAHLYTAVVNDLHSNTPNYKIKPILELLDENPPFNESQLKLWHWVAEYYLCSVGEVFQAACPSALQISSNTFLKLQSSFEKPLRELAERDQAVINHLLQNGDTKVNELIKLLGLNSLASSIKKLKEQGFLESYEKLSHSYRPKTESYIQLTDDFEEKAQDAVKGAKQLEMLAILMEKHQYDEREWQKKEFMASYNISASVIKALEKKSVIQIIKKQVSRIPRVSETTDIPKLNMEQQKVFENIQKQRAEEAVHLLFGVTSSGKTEVYAHLIKKEIEAGNQVLYMLPEIALTGQLMQRLQKYFGKDLLCYHSRMSDAEQYEIWQAVAQNKGHLILGTRSSIFLPFKKLSFIIVDEEHDSSYKQQDPAPRYNARDVAIYMSKLFNIEVLLGSATPSIESYHNALRSKYALHRLEHRFGNWKMPEIIISDMKEEYRKKKTKASFGSVLYNAINQCLENKEQVILFQNRRGFSPFIQCDSCGHIPECPNCDISLSYHKGPNILSCHYCGHNEHVSGKCHECQSVKIRTRGIGTEKLEEDLHILFPEAQVARMDLDTTRGKKSFEKITANMQNGKTDILVGTQMLTKGFDFKNIALVGVINADNLMFFPDFRAFEKSFQLLTQISGRAGRRSNKAKVIIQSHQPDTEVITNLTNNSIEQFLNNQLIERQSFSYPPYTRLIEVFIMHKLKSNLENAAKALKNLSTFDSNVRVLGPEYESIQRLRSWYRMRMIIKFSKADHSTVKTKLKSVLSEFSNLSESKGIRINLNVDPL